MSLTSTQRLAAAGTALLFGLTTACGDGAPIPSGPTSYNGIPQAAVIVTGWDFTGLIGTANSCQDWGTSKTVLNGAFGSVELTSGDNGDGTASITSKGLGLAIGDTERGLGLALNGACNGDEVGEGGDGYLYVNFNGVLPAGSILTQVDLGSVQGTGTATTQEGWEIDISTTGPGGPWSPFSKGVGDGTNNTGDNITIGGLTLPTANLVLRFKKNLDAPGNATTDNDYVVKSVTTSYEEVEGGCTFTQGYWKTHAFGRKDKWPVDNLDIGGINYSKAELVAIMQAPTAGNGIMSLVQQLIAAKLNILNGAASSSIASAIADADALIDGAGDKIEPPYDSPYLAPSVTSALNDELTDYNEGITGPGHCE